MSITNALLKELRIKAGLTQKELADRVGVSQAHIAKIEKGKVDPRLSTVNRVLAVLTEDNVKKCGEVMTRGVFFARPKNSIMKVSEIMVRNGVSQLPVIDGIRVVGTITEESIVRNLSANIAGEKVENVMGPPLPMLPEETSINTTRPLLERHPGVLVIRGKEIVGIITRSDLLKTIS